MNELEEKVKYGIIARNCRGDCAHQTVGRCYLRLASGDDAGMAE
jgi:hypothetical protein